MKNISALLIVVLMLSLGCAGLQPPVPIQSMNNDQLLRHYYDVSNKADANAREAMAFDIRGNPVWAGIMDSMTERRQKQKIDAAMELRNRGIQP